MRRKMFSLWIIWFVVVCMWSGGIAVKRFNTAYSERKAEIEQNHMYVGLFYNEGIRTKRNNIIFEVGNPAIIGLHSWGVTNWQSLAVAMKDADWCEKTAKGLEAKANTMEDLYDELVRNSTAPVEEDRGPGLPLEDIHVFAAEDDRDWCRERARTLRDPLWRQEQCDKASSHLSRMASELQEATISSFREQYTYWLIIPLLLGVAPGLAVRLALSSAAQSLILKSGALRFAATAGSLSFLLAIMFATPKVYKVFFYSGDNATFLKIGPIFHRPKEAVERTFFSGLETSVVFGELLGALAIGAVAWVFASGVCRRNSESKQPAIATRNGVAANVETPQPEPESSVGVKTVDEPLDKQAEEFESSPMFKMGFMVALPDCNQCPESSGPFGESITNPIPVNGHIGTFTYLSRLRSKSGVGFMWHRLGSEESNVYPHPVDIYELVAIDASEWRTLYFGIYHRHRSTMAPKDLTLVPWSQMSDIERVMAKTGFPGHNQRVENFPFGLPDQIEQSKLLNQIAPDLGKTMAGTARKWIEQCKGKWGATYRKTHG